MLLSDILNKENNNLDLIRIIAALMVIYGHAYAISPEDGKHDFIMTALRFEYSGSLAVKIFFFISGLVVTNSLMKKRDLKDFIISRFFRIWPALIVAVSVGYFSASLISSLSYGEFIHQTNFFQYIWKSITLRFTWVFPGVFEGNKINTFNGSLWSLFYEVWAYLSLLSIVVISRFNRIAISISCLLVIIDSIYGFASFLPYISGNEEIRYLPSVFCLGVLLSVNQSSIKICYGTIVALFLLSVVFKNQGSRLYIFTLLSAIMFFLLYVSASSLALRLKPSFDISYGIYLYGFPIQQFTYMYTHDLFYGVIWQQVISSILSIVIALLSWKFIESKFILIGKSLQKEKKATTANSIHRM